MKSRMNRPAPKIGGSKMGGGFKPAKPAVRSGGIGGMSRGIHVAFVKPREVKREALRDIAQSQNRVRPQVRPASAPRRIMPARPGPAAVRSVPAHGSSILRTRAVPRPGMARPPGMLRRQVVAPRSPARSLLPVFILNSSQAHPNIAMEVNTLQGSLTNLQDLSTFDDMIEDLNELDRNLQSALSLLESARTQNYRYQKDLDELAIATLKSWQAIHQKVAAEIQQAEMGFQNRLTPLGVEITRLNSNLGNLGAATGYLRTTESTVNSLLRDVNQVRAELRTKYSEIQNNTGQLMTRLTIIHWALGQLKESLLQLEGKENLVMAVKARWDQEGEQDPEGILFLTDVRLVFERKERVATKKILFITTAKELVQEILINESKSAISGTKAASKGLFGHQDFLEVTFAGKLGKVDFHIDGQDSENWSGLVERVRNGKIDADRALEGALSIQDLIGEMTSADILSVQNEVNLIQEQLMLSGLRDELEQVENNVRSLERELAEVRAHGYVIEKDMEGEIAILATQWDRIKANAEKTLETQAELLAGQSKDIQAKMSQLAGLSANLPAARPVYMQLKSSLASAEAQSAAAQDTVFNQFDDYAAEVEGLDAHLDWIAWMLEAQATASFKLMATESGVAATEALFALPGRETENGVLFLTDQRLLWEDRVGQYELKVNVPLSQVAEVRAESVEEDEQLVFTFAGGAELNGGSFTLAAPVGQEWLTMVGRARNGDYAADRAVPIDPAEIERIRNAPTQCSNCGGQFTTPILRGQVEISCEFCGVVTRL